MRPGPKSAPGDPELVSRLLKRAEIRRKIPTRKSVQEGKPDRIADLLEEAAAEIVRLRHEVLFLEQDLETVQRKGIQQESI